MIHVERKGAFVFATLDAAATRNALSDSMVHGLDTALELAASQRKVRALVIRGARGTFCAGGDFSRFRDLIATSLPSEGVDPIAVFSRAVGAMLQRLAASPVATIAVVEGAAIGGGVGLAAACDFVLASKSAQFRMPEVTLGLPPAQIAPFIAARLGRGAALRLMLTGMRLSASAALEVGLADEVLEDDQLDIRVSELLTEIGRAEPAALRATKAIVHKLKAEPLNDTLDFAARAFATALRSGNATEGLAAFAARRSTRWVANLNEEFGDEGPDESAKDGPKEDPR